MKAYKQPETRIKRVKDHKGERFYAQHKQVIIPHIWWEWQDTRQICDEYYADSLQDAKECIDSFLRKSKHHWASSIETTERKKRIKKEVEIIDYP